MTTYIYGLLDPHTKALRYVGKSNNPNARLSSHVNCAKNKNYKTPVIQWVRELMAQNLLPEVVLIEDAGDDWQMRELEIIEQLKAQGYPLLNVRKGGMRTGNQNSISYPDPKWWRPTVAPYGKYDETLKPKDGDA